MTNQEKLIEFKGTLTFEVIGQLLNDLKKKMDDLQETVAMYKRILIIMVETLENICKYADYQTEVVSESHQYQAVFSLVRRGPDYFLMAGNLIKNEDQLKIEERIDQVNQLDPVELKKLYRQIIANGNFTSEGGAGLGFIEIAKSCGRRIGYDFQPVNDVTTFFTLNLEITEKENGKIRNKRN